MKPNKHVSTIHVEETHYVERETPPSVEAGERALYADSDGDLRKVDPDGGESVVGVRDDDPVVIGKGASGTDSSLVIGPNSSGGEDSVVVGEGLDASGNRDVTAVGQDITVDGNEAQAVGDGNAVGPKSQAYGHDADANYQETVTVGYDAQGANRNSVAIGSHVNENAPDHSLGQGWSHIRVAVGSRAAANKRGTAVGPGAGEWGSPGTNVVNVGNEASAAADYAIAIGDQREVGRDGNEEPMIKAGATAAVAIGTSVEVATPKVARIGTAGTERPSPRQLVFQGAEQLEDADYVEEELTLLVDEANDRFLVKGKDSTGTVREATLPW